MLKQRLITASILIPLVVWGIFSLSNATFAWILAVIVLAGAMEWAALIGLTQPLQRALYAALVALCMAVAFLLSKVSGGALFGVLLPALLWWLVALGWLARSDGARNPAVANRAMGRALLIDCGVGIVLLVPAWLALVLLHGMDGGPGYLLFLMVMIWAADSGAYFSGRRWGRSKLAPSISPGKTWEGVAGGLALVTLLALLGGGMLFGFSIGGLLLFLPLCLLVVLFSVAGDLFESMFKRRIGVKDSGRLLPGHGGVLDRIDSLTAAAPLFLLVLLVMGLSL
ncbi:MAG: phosphatidate cytidylyltransferase [Gammaproteobacteria bacterium]|nr:phosphatidate cytidylyltransferase [Gammaproteobacteria bacterium]